MTRHTTLSFVGALALLALTAGAAGAQSAFSVDPLLIKLDARANNAVITITNPTAKEIRFEVKAFAWDQAPPNGTMMLTPSTDVVIFPPLVSLKPHTIQRVRVGTTSAQGPIEKAYRIMIEELPTGAAPVGATQVAVRTRIGVPVFIEPTKVTLSGKIDSVTVARRVVSVALTNTGTTHAMVDNVVIRGMSGPDEVVFEESLQGWYVLAGKTRTWDYTSSASQCRPAKFLEIEVYAHDQVLTSKLDMPANACTQ